MVFSSVIFLCVFFPITLGFYYLIPKGRIKLKNFFLLVMSLLFYGWEEPRHLWILFASIAINYFGGLMMDVYKKYPAKRKEAVVITVILNIALLVYFKYFNFMMDNVNRISHNSIVYTHVVLPIGISFFTFQGISYVIDVYRKKVDATQNPLDIALYISLFPQLVAGPIVRYIDIHREIKSRSVNLDDFTYGIRRFVVGLSKKVLIADTGGKLANDIFAAVGTGIDTPTAWLGIFCYAFQIYFDFSGYSDMVIGLGRMFGFRFLENFDYPYISKSITEFWRRWHISLSIWFKEYLYIPLGGNRKGNVYVNLLIVFCTTGIWHGASWVFLIWGLWHGVFLMLEKLLIKKELFYKIPGGVRYVYTMLVVIFGWVLFRSFNMEGAFEYFKAMFGTQGAFDPFYSFAYYFNAKTITILVLAALGSTPLMKNIAQRVFQKPGAVLVQNIGCLCLLFLCIVYIVSGSFSPFIYFQF